MCVLPSCRATPRRPEAAGRLRHNSSPMDSKDVVPRDYVYHLCTSGTISNSTKNHYLLIQMFTEAASTYGCYWSRNSMRRVAMCFRPGPVLESFSIQWVLNVSMRTMSGIHTMLQKQSLEARPRSQARVRRDGLGTRCVPHMILTISALLSVAFLVYKYPSKEGATTAFRPKDEGNASGWRPSHLHATGLALPCHGL